MTGDTDPLGVPLGAGEDEWDEDGELLLHSSLSARVSPVDESRRTVGWAFKNGTDDPFPVGVDGGVPLAECRRDFRLSFTLPFPSESPP